MHCAIIWQAASRSNWDRNTLYSFGLINLLVSRVYTLYVEFGIIDVYRQLFRLQIGSFAFSCCTENETCSLYVDLF